MIFAYSAGACVIVVRVVFAGLVCLSLILLGRLVGLVVPASSLGRTPDRACTYLAVLSVRYRGLERSVDGLYVRRQYIMRTYTRT